jgi:hypothetical protein
MLSTHFFNQLFTISNTTYQRISVQLQSVNASDQQNALRDISRYASKFNPEQINFLLAELLKRFCCLFLSQPTAEKKALLNSLPIDVSKALQALQPYLTPAQLAKNILFFHELCFNPVNKLEATGNKMLPIVASYFIDKGVERIDIADSQTLITTFCALLRDNDAYITQRQVALNIMQAYLKQLQSTSFARAFAYFNYFLGNEAAKQILDKEKSLHDCFKENSDFFIYRLEKESMTNTLWAFQQLISHNELYDSYDADSTVQFVSRNTLNRLLKRFLSHPLQDTIRCFYDLLKYSDPAVPIRASCALENLMTLVPESKVPEIIRFFNEELTNPDPIHIFIAERSLGVLYQKTGKTCAPIYQSNSFDLLPTNDRSFRPLAPDQDKCAELMAEAERDMRPFRI